MRWPAARMASQASKGYGMYEAAALLERGGSDIIHLEVGRPSAVTPEHIREAAKVALDNGTVHYGDLQGLAPLRESLADRYKKERGLNYTADEILITDGVTQAAYSAFMSALNEGDEVLVLDPFYPQHNSKIRLAGGRVVQVPMRLVDGTFRLDAGAVEAAVTPSSRMLVLINPANPIGTVYTRQELEALSDVAKRHDLLVLSDEVYEYITFDGREHISIASLPEMKERTITVSAFTKAYAMDGWRVGWVAAPEYMIADMRRITMNSTTHPCVFAQEGALTAVVDSQDCVVAMVAEDRRRRDLVVNALNAIPGITCSVPEGTIYAFPDVSELKVEVDTLAIDILESVHVAVESGSFYGSQGGGRLRVCFGSEPYDRLAEALRRLKTYFEKPASRRLSGTTHSAL